MQTVSSKALAEALGKRHDNILRDIRKYIAKLGSEAPLYFVEGSYTDGVGKARSCYEVTQRGCELIAGRMIGEKGRAYNEWLLKNFYPEVETPKADLTVEEVAERLGCSERNVYRIIQKGKLQAVQKQVYLPVVKIFVTEEMLEAYLACNKK